MGENVTMTLYVCYKELDRRFGVVNSNNVTKKSRIEAIILENLTPISKADICSMLKDVSPTTVDMVLGKMVKEGIIEIIGKGRNTKYRKR